MDDEDYEELSKYTWHCLRVGYAARSVHKPRKRLVYMHQQVLDFPSCEEIDHINRNKLDNRKENLRAVSKSVNRQNMKLSARNTSGYRGVSSSGRMNKPWYASIRLGPKTKPLGRYTTKEEAAQAYDKAAIAYFGPKAAVNFPCDGE